VHETTTFLLVTLRNIHRFLKNFHGQGSVATFARCSGIFNIHLTTNLPRNLPVKFFLNRFLFDKIMVMSLWPHFWPTL